MVDILPYILIVLIGIGFLFPIATLAEAIDYWDTVYSGYDFEFIMLTEYTSIKLVVVFFVVFFTYKKPDFDLFISNGLFGGAVALIVIASFYYANISTYSYYSVSLSAVAIAAVSGGLLDASIYAFVATYPMSIQEGLQLGIGLSYFISSLFRIITKASFASSIVESTLIYFYLAGVFVLVCIVLHQYLLSLPVTKERNQMLVSSIARLNRLSGMVSENSPLVGTLDEMDGMEISFSEATRDDDDDDDGKRRSCCEELGLIFKSKIPQLNKVLLNESMLCLTFALNIFLFPGLVAQMKSYNYSYLNDSDWWPVILEVLYTGVDLCGRMCIHYRGSLTSENIWIPAVCRLLFIPFFLCSVYGFLFTNDIWTICFILLAGFSGGYLTPIIFMTITDDVQPHERLVVGMFSGFFSNLGSVIGSLAALKFSL